MTCLQREMLPNNYSIEVYFSFGGKHGPYPRQNVLYHSSGDAGCYMSSHLKKQTFKIFWWEKCEAIVSTEKFLEYVSLAQASTSFFRISGDPPEYHLPPHPNDRS